MNEDKCPRCYGCGQLADSDDQEPWSVWMDLPFRSSAAVIMGLVNPIPCPKCGGTGRRAELTPEGRGVE